MIQHEISRFPTAKVLSFLCQVAFFGPGILLYAAVSGDALCTCTQLDSYIGECDGEIVNSVGTQKLTQNVIIYRFQGDGMLQVILGHALPIWLATGMIHNIVSIPFFHLLLLVHGLQIKTCQVTFLMLKLKPDLMI